MVELLPKFLVIRFAPGSGANFLTSVLQCSPEVGHWQEYLEHNKSTVDWLAYFKQCFQPDFDYWLQKEPVANQRLGTREIFSAWYDRGDQLTVEEFLNLERQHCSEFYFELKRKGVFIPIYWHKDIFPSYFQHASFIDILLDRTSLKWFDRSLYRKHYKVVDVADVGSILVQNRRHRPEIVPQTFTGSNEFEKTYSSFTRFVKEEIIGNCWRNKFQNPSYLTDASGDRPTYTLTLEDILEFDLFKQRYAEICQYLSLTSVSEDLLRQLHNHWRTCHDY